MSTRHIIIFYTLFTRKESGHVIEKLWQNEDHEVVLLFHVSNG